MHRQILKTTIASYKRLLQAQFPSALSGERERLVLARFEEFIGAAPQCFAGNHFTPGHLTGSALVVSPDFKRVVLTHHRKLGLWLQLGGHADGHHLLHEVALREAEEESGLQHITFATLPTTFAQAAGESLSAPLPFDFDIHEIPAHKEKPAHLHFDVRYLMVAADSELTCSAESLDLRWFSLEEARQVTAEASMHRQFDKLAWLLEAAEAKSPDRRLSREGNA